MFCEGRVVKSKSGSLFGKRALYRVKRAICFMKRALSHLQKRPSSWKEPYVSCKKLFYNIFCEGCVVKDKIHRHFSLQKKSPVFHEKSLAFHEKRHCNTLQHTATHCNTLQHTTTHCNTLQHTATHCTATHSLYEESSFAKATSSASNFLEKVKRSMYFMKRALLLQASFLCTKRALVQEPPCQDHIAWKEPCISWKEPCCCRALFSTSRELFHNSHLVWDQSGSFFFAKQPPYEKSHESRDKSPTSFAKEPYIYIL